MFPGRRDTLILAAPGAGAAAEAIQEQLPFGRAGLPLTQGFRALVGPRPDVIVTLGRDYPPDP